eukprot:TRINITY_DN5118_c0_g1_i1.p1 TRINITY_DN5118_c0_g1~~TRINITY_DN5118_c0_g1_i1.p1  ORF type:complete len:487 (-),score=122.51 TRINITY_DN5118_c0_g1_i1:38-1498(-)
MTFTKRIIAAGPTLVPDDLHKAPGFPIQVLQGTQATSVNGLLVQLGWLASYAHEMFTDLFAEASNSFQKLETLTKRAEKLAPALSVSENKLYTVPDRMTVFNQPGVEYRPTIQESESLLDRERYPMPTALARTYDQCNPAPALERVDKFAKDGSSALRKYTDPQFFKEQWIEAMVEQRNKNAEERKARREARRAERQRRRQKKAEETEKKKVRNVAVVKKKQYSAWGAEFAVDEIPVVQVTAQGATPAATPTIPREPVTIAPSIPVREPVVREPVREPTPTVRPAVAPPEPTIDVSLQDTDAAATVAAVAPVRSRGPPPPPIEEYEAAAATVRSAPSSVTSPAAAVVGTPVRARGPPPPPLEEFTASLSAPVTPTLRSVHARPAPPTPPAPANDRDSMLLAIRGGIHLKKAEPIEKPTDVPMDKHSALLHSIRSGITLKKATARELAPPPKKAGGPMTVAEILAKTIRPAMQDSDSDSDLSDDEWD